MLSPINKGQSFTVINQLNVHELYGRKITQHLKENRFKVNNLIIRDNESAKSIPHAEYCWKKLISLGCDRSSVLIALGGGVTGDLTGFLASTIFRGIQYVQVPTTLLAMVDSSIGGKTGINLEEGKNLIGSFYQPNSVVIDPIFLKSLPEIEIKSGMGEILKYGAIENPEIIPMVLSWINNGSRIGEKIVRKLIYSSCKIKADIIAKDEHENNLRRILNFGHTFGHALEAATNFTYFTHGEAVMHGMRFAVRLSKEIIKSKKDSYIDLIKCVDLLKIKPIPDLKPDILLKFMNRDKKKVKNKINFVLLEELGKPVILDNIPMNLIEENIRKYLKDF